MLYVCTKNDLYLLSHPYNKQKTLLWLFSTSISLFSPFSERLEFKIVGNLLVSSRNSHVSSPGGHFNSGGRSTSSPFLSEILIHSWDIALLELYQATHQVLLYLGPRGHYSCSTRLLSSSPFGVAKWIHASWAIVFSSSFLCSRQ